MNSFCKLSPKSSERQFFHLSRKVQSYQLHYQFLIKSSTFEMGSCSVANLCQVSKQQFRNLKLTLKSGRFQWSFKTCLLLINYMVSWMPLPNFGETDYLRA